MIRLICVTGAVFYAYLAIVAGYNGDNQEGFVYALFMVFCVALAVLV